MLTGMTQSINALYDYEYDVGLRTELNHMATALHGQKLPSGIAYREICIKTDICHPSGACSEL